MFTNSLCDDIQMFDELLSTVDRQGCTQLLDWLHSTDFFCAPASTRFHESYKGGLVEHSLRVYIELYKLVMLYTPQQPHDSVVICGLLHDVCKANFYSETTRNVKKNGVWSTEPFYKVDEQYPFGGHGSKSVFLVQQFIQLRHDEAAAINTHMGAQGNDYSCYDTYRKFPLAMLLHTADMIATCEQIRQEIED